MALSCADFLRRLDELEALDSADMREHARSCASCRLAFERWQAAAGQMRDWAEEEPPAFLHTRLMAELRAARVEASKRRVWRAWRPIWVSAAAAVALVVVGVGLSVFRGVPSLPEPASRSRASGGGVVLPAAPQAGSEPAFAPQAKEPPARRPASQPEVIQKGSDRTRLETRDAGPKGEVVDGSLDMGVGDQPAPQELSPPPMAEAEERAAPAPPSQVEEARAADASVSAPRPSGGAVARRGARQEPAPAPAATAAFRSAGSGEVRRLASGRLMRLVPLAGGPARTVVLSAELASQSAMLIDVDAQGRFRLVDAADLDKLSDRIDVEHERREKRKDSAARLPALDPSDRAALDRLALAAGRYRIEAVQP